MPILKMYSLFKTWRLALALIWFGFSLYFLLKPAGTHSGIAHLDKVGHLVLFALQALLTLPLQVKRKGELAFILMVLCLWAATSEWLQAFLTLDRQADGWDFFADISGIGIALYLLYGLAPVKSFIQSLEYSLEKNSN